MNLYYKVLIMMFLAGTGAGVSLLVLAREITCQAVLNINIHISIAAAYAGGAGIALASMKRLKKSSVSFLNIVISFSAIASVFAVIGSLLFIRYYRVILGLQPEQGMPPFAAVVLPVIVFLPLAVFAFIGLAAGEAVVASEKAGKPGNIRLSAAAGLIAGALLYVLLLWRYYSNMDVLYAMGILVLAATYVLFRDKTMEGRYTMLAVITAVIIYLAFNVGGFREKADRASSRAVYKSYYVVAEKEFPTVKFVMAKKGGSFYVFENGSLIYVMPDEKYAEMAKFSQGKNIIIINGGAAGLVKELEKNRKIKSIISYEADPYVSYILENSYKNENPGGTKAEFKAGDAAKDADLRNKGFLADTVFINPGRAGPEPPYSKEKLAALKAGFMADGGRLVISADESGKAGVKEAVKEVFGNAAEEKGFITAVKE